MKIRIQSKSGHYNQELNVHTGLNPTLENALRVLRGAGGYETKFGKKIVFVPFEEIEYIELRRERDAQ